jgi:hypothetical protein
MKFQDHIARKKADPDGLGFEALRRQGIQLAQSFCGDVWTDFNVHDPGVTLLEALCYGLTDLIHRTDFPCEDYLTDAAGVIDYARQALFPPQEVFPSHAVIPRDYRRLLFDLVPEVDDLWVNPLPGDQAPPGLYALLLRLGETRRQTPVPDEERIVREVRARFVAHRNLCEDLREIAIGKPVYHELKGRVEIDGARDPNEILGDIYFLCSRRLASRIEVSRWREILAGGASLDRIFDGPLAEHGAIDAGAGEEDGVSIAELVGAIRGVEGVVDVAALEWRDEKGRRVDFLASDLAAMNYPCLKFPQQAEDMRIAVYKNAKSIAISHELVRRHFDKRIFDYRAFRDGKQDIAEHLQLPAGQYLGFKTYHSIQNHLPAVYGLGRFGLPDAQPPERKAKAKQLSAYLFVFEQIMADFQQQLEELPRLFSQDRELFKTYFHQLLRDGELPGIDKLYAGSLREIEARLADAAAQRDPVLDRRSRVLDHLLALYGEEYSQKSLRQFNYYYSETELEAWIVRNKLRFLEHIIDIGKARGLGFDYLQESWNASNISGLQKKLGILLGLHRFETSRSLCAVLQERGLSLVDDDAHPSLAQLPRSGMMHGKNLPPDDSEHEGVADFRLADEFPIFAEFIGLSIFRMGLDLRRYRIEHRDGEYVLGLDLGKDKIFLELDAFTSAEKAAEKAHALRRFLRRLNLECEGLHLVEHILLRPGDSPFPPNEREGEDFYGLRLSVVFPAWTARFGDREFQKLAEETVCLNCPAHVYPEILWLGFLEMLEFETLYKTWLELKRSDPTDCAELDGAAQALLAFLLAHRGADDRMRWV